LIGNKNRAVRRGDSGARIVQRRRRAVGKAAAAASKQRNDAARHRVDSADALIAEVR
jgi:hypothetical protein